MIPLIPVSYLCPYVISSSWGPTSNRIWLMWWDVTSESILWRLWLALSFLSSCCLDCFLWGKPAAIFWDSLQRGSCESLRVDFLRLPVTTWVSLETDPPQGDVCSPDRHLDSSLVKTQFSCSQIPDPQNWWNIYKCSLFLLIMFWGNLLHSNR